MTNTGTVYLIGAGPGDPGLVTLRAAELVATADVVVHDRLIPMELVRKARPDAEVIDVGKTAGDHTMSQDDINALLIARALDGKSVARVKGGDPYLFGRGGEEAEQCLNSGVPFEVVPGVTSALSGAAAAGIPATHRGVSTHVTIVTASSGPTGDGDPDFQWLANSSGTVVLLMGLRRVRHIAEQLIAFGAPSDRPVAVVSHATTSSQRTVEGTLSTIADDVEDAQLTSPAIVIVGDVVSLRDTLNWFERRPLFGKTIAVTRARAQASSLVALLAQAGANVVECPTIRTASVGDGALEAFAAAPQFPNYILFTSQNSVTAFRDALRTAGRDARALSGTKVAAIGPATTAALRAWGIEPDLVPPTGASTSIGLADLLDAEPMDGATVALVRAVDGDNRLIERLEGRGATVQLIPAYRTVFADIDADSLKAAAECDCVMLASASAARNFAEIFPKGTDLPPAISIGPITTEAAETLGFRVIGEASEPTVEALAAIAVSVIASTSTLAG